MNPPPLCIMSTGYKMAGGGGGRVKGLPCSGTTTTEQPEQ